MYINRGMLPLSSAIEKNLLGISVKVLRNTLRTINNGRDKITSLLAKR